MTALDVAPPAADWLAGRALLEHYARTGRVFDANSLRSELRVLGFGRFTSGRLFQLAEADGVIRQCGVRRSTDGPSRGAFVREWVGVGHRTVTRPRAEVVVPVQRDRDGRFTARPGYVDVPLPMEVGP